MKALAADRFITPCLEVYGEYCPDEWRIFDQNPTARWHVRSASMAGVTVVSARRCFDWQPGSQDDRELGNIEVAGVARRKAHRRPSSRCGQGRSAETKLRGECSLQTHARSPPEHVSPLTYAGQLGRQSAVRRAIGTSKVLTVLLHEPLSSAEHDAGWPVSSHDIPGTR
jgi:hypothetical protein